MSGRNQKNAVSKSSHPNSTVKQGKKSSVITWPQVPQRFYGIENPPIDESKVPKGLKDDLSKSNYAVRFHDLLYLSEICDKQQALKKLKVRNVELTKSEKDEGLFKIDLAGHFDKNSIMRKGDSVHVKRQPLSCVLKGRIRHIDKANKSIHVKFDENSQGNVEVGQNDSLTFYYSRIYFIRAHYAIELVAKENRIDFLFPETVKETTETNKGIEFHNKTLIGSRCLQLKRCCHALKICLIFCLDRQGPVRQSH